jgi:hypothetical protein
MVDPKIMCRQHLLGEHVELHMLVGSINRGISLDGYINDGLIELDMIRERHQELVDEMHRRGYRHKSPLPRFARALQAYKQRGQVDVDSNVVELARRCEACLGLQSTGGRHAFVRR